MMVGGAEKHIYKVKVFQMKKDPDKSATSVCLSGLKQIMVGTNSVA